MCFSPTASFTVAAALTVISALSFKKAKTSTLKLLALTPLFFALQQLLEGFVWLTLLKGDSTSPLHSFSVLGFLFFASIFWPCWIPEMFYLQETHIKRKVLLGITQCFGVAFAIVAAAQLYSHKAIASIADHHITYDVHWTQQVLTNFPEHLVYPIGMLVYLIAIVLPFFISSMSYAWLLGIIVVAGFIAAQIAFSVAFGSVWCFFAAVASLLMYGMISAENKKN